MTNNGLMMVKESLQSNFCLVDLGIDQSMLQMMLTLIGWNLVDSITAMLEIAKWMQSDAEICREKRYMEARSQVCSRLSIHA